MQNITNIRTFILLKLLQVATVIAIVEEELYDCEDDVSGKFSVTGMEEMQYCDWAASNHTEERCMDANVSWQCPTTCEVPCIDSDGNIRNAPDEKYTPMRLPEVLILICALFCVVAIAAIITSEVKQKKSIIAVKRKKKAPDQDCNLTVLEEHT
jgi:hypothetical protein